MKISRLAVVIGSVAALAASTGSSHAQAEGSGGALADSLGAWVESAEYEDPTYSLHQICEEFPSSPAPSSKKV